MAKPRQSGATGRDTVRLYRDLWRGQVKPDLEEFLRTHPAGQTADLVAILRTDQHERWRRGEHPPAEAYVAQLRAHHDATAEQVVELVYAEIHLRREAGEKVNADEYARRFPDLAERLREQLAFSEALASADVTEEMAQDAGTDSRPLGPGGLPLPCPFGRYEVRELLGQGGMGAVYLAHDTQLDRPVALKVPNLDDPAGSHTAKRFRREAKAAAGFRHPNLCPVYDFGEVGGVHYLTMPLITGRSLADAIKEGEAMPEREAAALGRRLAEAMAVAHAAGVIHRDLKPGNVILDERDEPVVTDFGLALRTAAGEERLTSLGTVIGSPAYIAPELLEAGTAVGPSCDIYSLGVMFYEMLTGRLPFESRAHELMALVLHTAPPPPSQHRPGLDSRLEAICLTAMAKKPGERFPTMDAFAGALTAYLNNETGPALPRSQATAFSASETQELPATRPVRRGSRQAIRWAAVSTAMMLVLALSMYAWWASRTQTDDPLAAGTVWSGTIQISNPADGKIADVEVKITERDGERFRGSYATEKRRYEWRITGRLQGNAIQWDFTEAVRDNEDHSVVGLATVDGTLAADTLHVWFRQPHLGHAAQMTLRLEK